MDKTPQIVSLEVENVKRVKLVRIKPDGSTVIVGGKNAAGKSSLLDSIEMLLGGGRSIPEEPLRRGTKKGRIVGDFGSFVVSRVFEKGGSKNGVLEVKRKDGKLTGVSHQKFLDDLVGSRLGFDPLGFDNASDDKQVDILKRVSGVDLDAIEKERDATYGVRTNVNRDLKAKEAEFNAAVFHDNAPKEEMSAGELAEELARIQEANRLNQAQRDRLAHMRDTREEIKDEIFKLNEEVVKLEVKLDHLNKIGKNVSDEVSQMVDEDEDVPKAKLATVDEQNAKVRDNARHEQLKAEFEKLADEHVELDATVTALDEKKREAMGSAKLPIEGLGIEDGRVTLDDIPLKQCSQAQRLKTSVAIGVADSKIKLAISREGSLLDLDNLALVAKTVDELGGFLWLERVGEGEECSFIMEDGEVKGQ